MSPPCCFRLAISRLAMQPRGQLQTIEAKPFSRHSNPEAVGDSRDSVNRYTKSGAQWLGRRRRKARLPREKQAVILTSEEKVVEESEAEMHRLDSGHFAVEDSLDEIAENIRRFYEEKVATSSTSARKTA
jgi:hypothetical protein